MTDLESVTKEIDALLAAPAEPTVKSMTADEFEAYAKDQIVQAKAETTAGKSAEARKRLEALKAETDKVRKFEFKGSELPSVSVYRDPGQLTTTTATQAPATQATGGPGWGATAKTETAVAPSEPPPAPAEGTPAAPPSTPPAPPVEEPPVPAASAKPEAWPSDMAAAVKEPDPDRDWGKDSVSAA